MHRGKPSGCIICAQFVFSLVRVWERKKTYYKTTILPPVKLHYFLFLHILLLYLPHCRPKPVSLLLSPLWNPGILFVPYGSVIIVEYAQLASSSTGIIFLNVRYFCLLTLMFHCDHPSDPQSTFVLSQRAHTEKVGQNKMRVNPFYWYIVQYFGMLLKECFKFPCCSPIITPCHNPSPTPNTQINFNVLTS